MSINYMSSVPKLLGRENYDDWAFAVENFMVLEGLSKTLEGTDTNEENVVKAKAKLVLTLDASLYIHIKEAKTAQELWKKLKSMYADTGFTRKIGLLRTLISLRLENCESMESYVNQVIEASQKLKKTGFKIDDNWVGSLLLAGLPERYAPMIMAIEHSGIDITTDSIKTKLLDMQEEYSSSGKGGKAFAVKFKLKTHNRDSSKYEKDDPKDKFANVQCFRCKKHGHYMNKCPNKHSDSKFSKSSEKVPNAFSAVFMNGNFNDSDWYVDSGASLHLTARKDWLENICFETLPTEIMVANKSTMPIVCSGDVKLTSVVNTGKRHEIIVKNVRYVPKVTTNLLSVNQLIRNGNNVTFDQDSCKIFNKNGELLAEADCVDSVYRLKIQKRSLTTLVDSSVANLAVSGDILHRRFHEGAVSGLKCNGKIAKSEVCQVCCEGKQARLSFKKSNNRAESCLEVIHADLCGPMEMFSIGSSRYFLLFEDDYSRMSFIYLLKSKDQALEFFKEFKEYVQNHTGKKIKVLRTDGGGEFCSNAFEKFLRQSGIVHQKTNAHCPEQNGMLERLNRTVVEKVRCLLYDANLGKEFWAEAVYTAVYLRNRSVVKGLNNKTPYEMWTHKRPDVSHIRIFGSEAMVHIPKVNRRKLDKKSTKMILVGFSDNIKGYRLYDKEKKKVITSRDVCIIEKNIQNIPLTMSGPEKIEERPVSVGDINIRAEDDMCSTSSESEIHTDDSDYVPDEVVSAQDNFDNNLRRSERDKKPKIYDDFVTYMCTTELEDVPITVSEALSRPDADCWREAMADEIKSFEDNQTWELIDRPPGASVVQCKWVFKKKCDNENRVSYRARLVAKGFSQKAGVDFDETFAPVIRYSSLRMLIALSLKLNLTHLDVKTAFLNGYLQETVLMKQPEGFVLQGQENNA